MATDVGSLIVQIEASTAKLRSELARAERSVGGTANQIEGRLARMDKRFEAFGATLKSAFAGLALGAVARDIIDANVEFGRLQAALVSVTGSAEKAQGAFGSLEKFAAETPFQLNEVVDGFIKLQARGLDPSIESLRSFGNTASAMGKSLDQFIEAVADAATGEFERLKEFGINASKNGDKVKITFQGVTTTVRASARAIVGELRRIGDEKFGDAMERQMETLGGKLSNLQDQIGRLYREIGEGGLNEALIETVDLMTQTGSQGESLARMFGERLGATIQTTGKELKLLIDGLDRLEEMGKKAGRAVVDFFTDTPVEDAQEAIEEVNKKIGETQEGLARAQTVYLETGKGLDEVADREETLNKLIERRKQLYQELTVAKAEAGEFNDGARRPPRQPTRVELTTGTASPPTTASDDLIGSSSSKRDKGKDTIKDLEHELSLLKMTSKERAVAEALHRAGADASKAEAEQIRNLAKQLFDEEAAREKVNNSIERATDLAQEELSNREAASQRAKEIIADRQKLVVAMDAEAERARVYLNLAGMSEQARRTEIKLLEIRERFRAQGIPLGDREIEQARELAKTVAEAEIAAENYNRMWVQFGDLTASAFEDAIVNGEKLRDVLAGLMEDLARMGIRSGMNSLFSAIGGALMGGGGPSIIPGTIGSGSGVGFTGSEFGGPAGEFFTLPARAMGGPVEEGTAYMVGETGKEIFVPNVDGKIIPNTQIPNVDRLNPGHATPTAAAPGMTVYIDAKGADQAAIQRLEAGLRTLNASIEHRAVNAVSAQAGKGGGFAKSVGRR